jgi:hypothetical protein
MRKREVKKTANRLDDLMLKMASKKNYEQYLKLREAFRKELGLEN